MYNELNSKIEMVLPDESSGRRMMEIRFDCLVRMFDMGNRAYEKPGLIFDTETALPPQWFKSEHKLTLENIKNCDPYALGMEIKNMLHQLEYHIEKWEGKK